jgi:hypothetical protein
MSNEQINIAIAKACGWYEEDNESEICWTRDELTYCLHEDELPNYCNNLNAMHEAEKVLTTKGVNAWWEYVGYINRRNPTPFGSETAVHATARQRAEAFLRTLGKWEEATK